MRNLVFILAILAGVSVFASEKVKMAIGVGYSVCYSNSFGCAYTLAPEVYEIELKTQDDTGALFGKLPLTFETVHNRKFKIEITVSKIQPSEWPAQYNIQFQFWDVKNPHKKIKGIITAKGSMENLDIVTIYGNPIKTAEFELIPELYLSSADYY